MKENKYMLKGFKYLINNEKKKFILVHGVITRGFIVVFATTLLFSLLDIVSGDMSTELKGALGLLIAKVILGLIAGYITGVIEWNYYKAIVDRDDDEKAYRKFAILDGIVGWGLIMWIIQIKVRTGQLLANIVAESLSLLIWSLVGAGLGLMIWVNMDVDKIRKSVRENRGMDI